MSRQRETGGLLRFELQAVVAVVVSGGFGDGLAAAVSPLRKYQAIAWLDPAVAVDLLSQDILSPLPKHIIQVQMAAFAFLEH